MIGGLLAGLLLPSVLGAVPADGLVLVDDRGEPLGSPVEVCFVEGLGTDCTERPAGAGPLELPAFDLLRIEGPDHGPIRVRPRDLPAREDSIRRLQVPRKATLRVRNSEGHRLTAALHSTEDFDPARPAHSLAVPAEGELEVPAGDWLLTLESRGAAPDLHRLPAAPGSTQAAHYRSRQGWSLVVRAVSKEDEAPVVGARVAVLTPEPVHAPRRDDEGVEEAAPPRTAQTGAAGLGLFPGLDAPVVIVEVRHPDFAETTLPGISSTSGVLEHRTATLGKGATLDAEIRVDGEPGAGWRCALLDRARPSRGRSSHEVEALKSDSEGICRGEKLPEGLFWLRVTSPREEGAVAEREVQLYDGEAATVRFDLTPIRVHGEVFKGQEPGAGYRVGIYRLSEGGSTQLVEPVAVAATVEDGSFETTVWDPGEHSLQLRDPRGQSVDSERADVQPSETTVDFHLAPGEIEGIVVDEDGEPVAGATVMVQWDVGTTSSGRVLRTPEDGTFRLAREAETGTLEVNARHRGYRPDTARLELAEDAVAPPIVLTLRRMDLLQGRVATSAGTPVSGVAVQSFAQGPNGGLQALGTSRTDGDGRFEVEPAEGKPTRLFASGPGCPLIVADVAQPSESPVLTCPETSGTLALRFVDLQGRSVSGLLIRLRRGETTIPREVLAGHLLLLGRSSSSDNAGRLVLPGLPPGIYEIHVGGYTSVPIRIPQGPVATVTVAPSQLQELEVAVEATR